MLSELETIIPVEKQSRGKRARKNITMRGNKVIHLPRDGYNKLSTARALGFVMRRDEVGTYLAQLAEENKLLRKPCGICGNLVKPELLEQHNEAYHPH